MKSKDELIVHLTQKYEEREAKVKQLREDNERIQMEAAQQRASLAAGWKTVVRLMEDVAEQNTISFADTELEFSFDEYPHATGDDIGVGALSVANMPSIVDYRLSLDVRVTNDGVVVFQIVDASGKPVADAAISIPIETITDDDVEHVNLQYLNAISRD